MKPTALFVAVALAFAGCVAIQPMENQFSESDFQAWPKNGTGVVVGQAFLKTRAGDVKFGAGNEVELTPLTPYIAERLNKSTKQGIPLSARDPKVDQYARKTRADGNGNFEFRDVPPGRYVIYCEIKWAISEYMQTGGYAYAEVEVANEKTVKAVVTR